ncbi:MAG: hypothetical protein SFY81_00765 [Verrucomicrobiota bacterium]|nr:hypothetical protein [Verrucomicrobiota bacterium]
MQNELSSATRMQDDNNPELKRRKYILLGSFIAAILLIVAFALLVYPHLRTTFLLKSARNYIEKRDYRNATLCLRQILEENPRNVDASNLMADLADLTQSPYALIWRQRLVQLEPRFLKHRINWIQTALQQGDISLAADGLASIDEEGRRTAAYHHLAASIAIARNQMFKAEYHASQALNLEPRNDAYQYNLALIHIHSKRDQDREKARQTLDRLLNNSSFRPGALRALISAEINRGDFQQALAYSAELSSERECRFTDRIQNLALLRKADRPEAATRLKELQNECGTDPELTLTLSKWMLDQGLYREVLQWLEPQPDEFRTTPQIRFVLGSAYAAGADWVAMTKFLDDSDWEKMEFLRQAFLARMAREKGVVDDFKIHWEKAIVAAAENPKTTTLLAQISAAWNWETEREELLWTIASAETNNRWALDALYAQYLALEQTENLFRVTLRVLEIDPSDILAKNNFAILALLQNVRLEEAYAAALEVYKRNPKNPIVLSTYAYALLHQGRTQAALNVFKGMSQDELKDPGISTYYGLVLLANNNPKEARDYLEAAKSARLLPEEKRLVTQALTRINALNTSLN